MKYTKAHVFIGRTKILQGLEPNYLRCLVVLIVMSLLTGCASVSTKADKQLPVWPPPPLTGRIEFVKTINASDDLDQGTTFLELLAQFLGGRKTLPNRIGEPQGLKVSDDGNRLYVSDGSAGSVYTFDFEKEKFTKLEGLQRPMGIDLDENENLYVVEQQKIGVSVFNRKQQQIMFITHADLVRPTDVAVDRIHSKIYVSDTAHTDSPEHNIKVFNMQGELIGKVGAEKGNGPGQLLFPTYLALDSQGNLYVADTLNSRVQKFDSDGNFVKIFGERGTGWGMFDKPKGVALDSFDNLYVVDTSWSNVQIFNQNADVLLFFGGRGPYPGMLRNPTSITIDTSDRIYVGDFLNHRVSVYRLVNTTKEDSYKSSKEIDGDIPEATPTEPSP